MEEDILNYLPTIMFRGTPCIKSSKLSYFTFKRISYFTGKLGSQAKVY